MMSAALRLNRAMVCVRMALAASFLLAAVVVVFAWAATGLETVLALALIVGFRIRQFAAVSCLLLLSFGTSMTFATGPEGPLSYSVWTAAAIPRTRNTTTSSTSTWYLRQIVCWNSDSQNRIDFG